jgi:amino acid adenylation domain-containing protein
LTQINRNCITEIETRARVRPGGVAVYCDGEGPVTLGEVNARANRLAHHLRELCDVARDEPVAVLCERSGWFVSSVIGVLKGGACHFPLSPSLPDERIALLLRDSGCRTAVVQQRWRDRLRACGGEALMLVDPERARGSACDPQPMARPQDAAALLYTSGSTGRPKGVVIEHHSLANLLVALQPMLYAPLGGRTREALSAPVVFDAALQQLLSCLANGSTLFVMDEEMGRDPHAFLAYVRRHRIEAINVVASFLGALVEAGIGESPPPSLRHIVTGGEPVSAATIRRLFAHPSAAAIKLFSMYGPTEACVEATCCVIDHTTPVEWPHVPLGTPLANVGVDVRDESLALCRLGEVGEICISGAGVARGYLHAPARARASFTAAPDIACGRLYRTGDRGRVSVDGTLEFVGRVDDQVKVRGHRVELVEVERTIAENPLVREVGVIAIAAPFGGSDLLACVAAPAGSVTVAELRAFAAQRLPPASVPVRWALVATLPHLDNGKLDRQSLALMADVASPSAAFRAQEAHAQEAELRGPLECAMAAIFEEVLGVARVGRDDDFLALGGHSLTAVQVVNRIGATWGVVLPVRLVLERLSVAALARELKPLLNGASYASIPAGIPRIPSAEHYSLSRGQERLWAVQQLAEAGAAYNVPVAMEHGRLDRTAVAAALATVAARHDSLRTAFRVIEGKPRQVIAERIAIPLDWLDVSGARDSESAAREEVVRDTQRPFQLEEAPLARATIIDLGEGRSWFVLVLNHLVCDGWSIGILSRELNAACRVALEGGRPALEPLPLRYVDYAAWDRARDVSAATRARAAELHAVAPWLELPTDFPRDHAASGFHGATHSRMLERGLADRLRHLADARRTTLAPLLLAVFVWLLHRVSRDEDLCIGMGVAARPHRDLESVVGFFVDVVPVRLRVSPELGLDALVQEAEVALWAALEARHVPLEALIRELALPRRDGIQPLVNVMFAYQSFADLGGTGVQAGDADRAGLTMEQARLIDVPAPTSKFDLTLYVHDLGGELRLAFEYDASLFRSETIDRHMTSLTRLAQQLAAEMVA